MPLKFSTITGPDGVPRLNVEVYDEPEGWQLVQTGPLASGVVRTSDGALYDVTPPAILVASPEHAGEVNHLIGVQHEEAGRYGLATEPVFGTHPTLGEDRLIGAPHKCTDACGAFKVDQVVHAEHLGSHQDEVAAIQAAAPAKKKRG